MGSGIPSGIHFESEENAPHKVSIHTYTYIKVLLTNSEDPVYGVCEILTDITERIKAGSECGTFALKASRDLQSSLRKISQFGNLLK
jgi:hypothetical protein